LCRANNLSFHFDETNRVVRVVTLDEFQKSLTSFSDQQTKVFTLLYPNPVLVAEAISNLYGDRVKLSLGEGNSYDELQDLQGRFSKFDLIDQRSQGFGTNSSQLGTSANGGLGTTSGSIGSGGYGSGGYGASGGYGGSSGGYSQQQTYNQQRSGNNPNGNDINDDLGHLTTEQANRLARSLAQNPEAADQQNILDAYRKRRTSIYITVIRRNNNIIVRTSDVETMNEIGKLIERLDVPTSLVMLEVKVLAINLTDSFNSEFDFQFSNGSGVAAGFTSGDIIAPPADSLSGAAARAASLTPGGTGLQPGNAIFQVVSNNFRARLQALETKNRVTQLAAPLLLTANNEVSRLFVGEEYPIVQNITSQTVVNNNTSTTSPNTTINFQPVGTTLLLTPNINADHTVTLRVLQENSQVITGGATIPIVTGNGTIQSQPVDIVSTRTFSGTVVAKDGLSLAIGGLISEQVNDQRNEVPILGKLPVLGVLFRQQTTGRTRTEFVIMIRPFILNTPAESEALSQKLMKELSIHPKAGDFNGTLNSFERNEVPRPDTGKLPMDRIFRFHSVYTGDY
jgi:general secretion pathway protein D